LGVFYATASLADDVRNAVWPEQAGSFFASICFEIYLEDVAAAQIAAQRAWFKYDKETGLFMNGQKDQQTRINAERCALGFLAKTALPDLLSRFETAATKAAKVKPSEGTNIHIGTEEAGGGPTRAAAKLDL